MARLDGEDTKEVKGVDVAEVEKVEGEAEEVEEELQKVGEELEEEDALGIDGSD